MIGQAWALLDWQSRLVVLLVPVLVGLLAALIGGYIEWARTGGVRDLQQQLDGVRGLLAGYSADASDARAEAGRWQAAAGTERGRADRERSRRQAAEQELRELRAAAAEQGRTAVRAAEVVDLVLWEATRAGAGLTGHPPP